MTPEVLAALRDIVDELGADSGSLLRVEPDGRALVTSTTAASAVPVGRPWGVPDVLADYAGEPRLVTDPAALARLVPTATRLALPVAPTAALVAHLGGTSSYLVVLWAQHAAPLDTETRLADGAFTRFSLLAPLLDAQVQVAEAHQLLKAVVASLDQAIVAIEPGGSCRVNEAAARLLGVPAGAVPGAVVSAAMRALRLRAIDPTSLDWEAESLLADPDAVVRDWVWSLRGEPSHLRVTSSPMASMTGTGRVWVFDDISAEMRLLDAERRATQEVADSRALYRMLVENSSDVVFQTVGGALSWVSPTVTHATGWQPDQLVGSATTHLWHADDLDAAIRLRDRAYAGDNARGVLRFRCADGDYRWMEVSLRPFSESDGRTGAVGTMHDVSDRVLAERAAAASEERYRTLAENASDIVCSYGPDAVIDWIAGSTETLMGRTHEELIGTVVLDHFVLDSLGDNDANLTRLLAGETIRGLAQLKRADGRTRWIDRRTRAVFDGSGSVTAVISSWRDAQAEIDYREALAASEREARDLAVRYEVARNEAIEANLAKTGFLSRMSHELRTPLNAVLGFAQLLEMDPLTADQADAVAHIRTGGRHLLELINEILDISRIEAGRLSLSMESVLVADAVGEAFDLVRPLAAERGIELRPDPLTDDLAQHVWADRQRTIQILINLLTNAVKYNRPGGSATVSCVSLDDGAVGIRVTDTGMGIAPDRLARVFEPFDRLGAETTGIEGTGIGLTLSQSLARVMSGRVEVESQLGEGTTFTLVLPLSTAPSSAPLSPRPIPTGHAGRPVRVLYVEDNPANARLMERVVALRPHAVLDLATDGAHGLETARNTVPDLVLLDLHLPDLRGDDVLRRLRSDPVTAALPVVVVTADASPGMRDRLLGLGADGFLTKPIDVDAVLAWIDSAGAPGGAP